MRSIGALLLAALAAAPAARAQTSSLPDAIAQKQKDVKQDQQKVSGDGSVVQTAQAKVDYDQSTTVLVPACDSCDIKKRVPYCQQYPQQCAIDNNALTAAQAQQQADQGVLTQDSNQLAQLQSMAAAASGDTSAPPPPPPPSAPTDAAQTGAAGGGPAAPTLSDGGLNVYASQRAGAHVKAVNLNPSADDVAKLTNPDAYAALSEGSRYQAAGLIAPAPRPNGPDILNARVALAPGGDPASPALNLPRSAETKLKMGDLQGALNDALTSIKSDPKDPLGYLRAAQAYNKLRRYGDAENMARRTLALDPNNAEAWKNLAWALALAKQGRYKEALEAALTATKLNPNLAEAWAIAAYAAGKLGDPKARLAYLQRAAALDPRYQAALTGKPEDDDELILGGGGVPPPSQGFPWRGLALALSALAVVSAGATALVWKKRKRRRDGPTDTSFPAVLLSPPTPHPPRRTPTPRPPAR